MNIIYEYLLPVTPTNSAGDFFTAYFSSINCLFIFFPSYITLSKGLEQPNQAPISLSHLLPKGRAKD
jgi:hypothetical protein